VQSGMALKASTVTPRLTSSRRHGTQTKHGRRRTSSKERPHTCTPRFISNTTRVIAERHIMLEPNVAREARFIATPQPNLQIATRVGLSRSRIALEDRMSRKSPVTKKRNATDSRADDPERDTFMKSDRTIYSAAADVCSRVADALESASNVAAPLRRLAQLVRPQEESQRKRRRRTQAPPQPSAEPTELDRRRAQQALQRSGMLVKQNGGAP